MKPNNRAIKRRSIYHGRPATIRRASNNPTPAPIDDEIERKCKTYLAQTGCTYHDVATIWAIAWQQR